MPTSKKTSVYLETSVISGYFDAHLPDRQKTTREFFRKLGEFKVFISKAVIEEIEFAEGRKDQS